MAEWHGDFYEEEMWCYKEEKEDSSSLTPRKPREYSDFSSAWQLPSAPRRIPRVSSSHRNSSTKHETKIAHQSSAPLNIPDWSKIYGKHGNMDSSSSRVDNNRDDGMVYEEEDDDDDMVPPHEWLAKKLARSQISSFSVCEGIGRTLKGRDLSKVRNAVLTKTGFIE